MPVRKKVVALLKKTNMLGFARRVEARLYRWRGKALGPAGASSAKAQRVDPVPAMAPFPQARYVFAVGAIPRRYAGRTASVLTKARLFSELAGVESEILTMNYSSEVDDVTNELRRRGALAEGVRVINLHDFFGGDVEYTGDPVVHPVEEPGMSSIKDRDEAVYRYYENGVYRLYKRFDYEGRLIVRDWFNENRGRTRRDEFTKAGLIRRTTYFDLHYNKPRQEVYFRADGTAYMNRWLVVNPADLSTDVERITLFDREGRPTTVIRNNVELIQSYLDRLVGEDHVFLTVESRRTDAETLTYKRANVKQLYVLHNPHILSPFTNPHKIRPMYQPLLDRHAEVGATVFLTNAQRADAEAHYGRQDNFVVIPHPAQPVTLDPAITRDPRLVVMLARLDQQKQIDHAIDAFAHVLKQVPDARLEIYGRGPESGALQERINRLGVQKSVKLAGYTTNPGATYQQAALSLLTSRYEGFGLVLLESLMHGCPVVSYDLKYGPADIITDNSNGFLVPFGDKGALAKRMVELLTNPDLQQRMSSASLTVADRFSPEVFVARWSALFNKLDAEGWGETATR